MIEGWRGREIGTLFPVIAADFPDVICHSKEHSGDQMFRLNVGNILLGDRYRSSAWSYLSLLDTHATLMSLQCRDLC